MSIQSCDFAFPLYTVMLDATFLTWLLSTWIDQHQDQSKVGRLTERKMEPAVSVWRKMNVICASEKFDAFIFPLLPSEVISEKKSSNEPSSFRGSEHRPYIQRAIDQNCTKRAFQERREILPNLTAAFRAHKVYSERQLRGRVAVRQGRGRKRKSSLWEIGRFSGRARNCLCKQTGPDTCFPTGH